MRSICCISPQSSSTFWTRLTAVAQGSGRIYEDSPPHSMCYFAPTQQLPTLAKLCMRHPSSCVHPPPASLQSSHSLAHRSGGRVAPQSRAAAWRSCSLVSASRTPRAKAALPPAAFAQTPTTAVRMRMQRCVQRCVHGCVQLHSRALAWALAQHPHTHTGALAYCATAAASS